MLECLSDGRQQLCQFVVVGAIFLNPVSQRAAFDEFGNDVDRAIICATDIMHGNDVGMVQTGDSASFFQILFGIFRFL